MLNDSNMSKPSKKADAGVDEHFVEDYLPALLTKASHLIQSEFHRMVKAKGLTVSEWRVLATLVNREPMSMRQLSAIAVTPQPTLTAVLDRMEPRGLVTRTTDEVDRRVTLVGIAPAGTKLVAKLIDLAREHENRVLEPFGLQRSAQLKATLKRLIALHERQEHPDPREG